LEYQDIIVGLVAVGFTVGAIVGATGVGGGALMTPALIGIFGIPPQVAIATDLIFAAFVKSSVSIRPKQRAEVDWPLVFKIWLGALPAAVLAVFILRGFSNPDLVNCLLLCVALAIAFSGYSMLRGRTIKLRRNPPAAGFGALLGSLVSMTSVGAGALGMVFLRALMSPTVSSKSMVATDLAVAVPIALVAGAGHFAGGLFDGELFLLIAPAGLLGALIGSRIGGKVRSEVLRGIVGMILIFASLGMLLKVLS
jgi:uncharacterized membrane protein YfcA